MIRFIHIPKCAGQAITTWLEDNDVDFVLGRGRIPVKGRHKYKDVHRPALWYAHESFPKFAVVRNPYDRFVSYYTYYLQQSNGKWNMDFETFVRNGIGRPTKIPSHQLLQKDWVVDQEGNLLVENIFHFENLEHDLLQFFKLDVGLPRVNVSRNDASYKEYYTKDLADIVYDRFEQDFKMFNYSSKL